MRAPAKDKDTRERNGIQLRLVPSVAQAITADQLLPLVHHAHLAVVAQDYLQQRSVFRGRRKLLMFQDGGIPAHSNHQPGQNSFSVSASAGGLKLSSNCSMIWFKMVFHGGST
jgi:hypothetical protein